MLSGEVDDGRGKRSRRFYEASTWAYFPPTFPPVIKVNDGQIKSLLNYVFLAAIV
jgi:hypothetical protein